MPAAATSRIARQSTNTSRAAHSCSTRRSASIPQRDIFEPYKKNHSTVKDACELAEKLGVPNLVLYHTEDKSIEKRKALYTEEGGQYYHGNLIVPDDLETLEL